MPTFSDLESQASVRAKINAAITKVDDADAIGNLTARRFDTEEDLFDYSAAPRLTVGSYVEAGNSRYLIVSSGEHRTTLGGDKLYQVGGRVVEARTILVPSQFSTLQAAVDYIATLDRTNQTITIRMETGFAPTAGMTFDNGDFSSVRIEAVDALTTVHSSFTGNFITVNNGRGAVLACQVSMNNLGAVGYQINGGSSGTIAADCGVDYAGTIGLECTSGTASASKTRFRYANTEGIRAAIGGVVRALGVDVRGSQSMGLWASRGAVLHCDPADEGTGTERVTNASNCGVWGIRVRRSELHARKAIVTGCLDTAIDVGDNARVVVQYADCSGATTEGLRVADGSIVDALGINVEGYGSAGIYCVSASVYANNATARKDGTNDSSGDFRVEKGGQIFAYDAEGGSRHGFNLRTPNGVIWGNAAKSPGNTFRVLTTAGSNTIAYLLLVKKNEPQILIGDVIGVSRVTGTNPARAPVERISIVAGTRGTDEQFAYASVFVQGFAGGPGKRLVDCTYDGANYIALEVDPAGNFNQYAFGVYTDALSLTQQLEQTDLLQESSSFNLPIFVTSGVTSVSLYTATSVATNTLYGT